MNRDALSGTDAHFFDEVRRVLFALSNRGSLARRGRDESPASALHELHLVGDIQSLDGGRWLPCASATVPLGDLFLVVSGMSTPMLSHAISTPVFGEGSGRLVSSLPPRGISGSHSFEWWSETPKSTRDWVRQKLDGARYSIAISSELEFFNHWQPLVSLRWTPSLPRSTPDRCTVVARQKGPIGTLYYLCAVEKAKPTGLEELSSDWNLAHRMGFGLSALSDNASTFSVTPGAHQHVEITLSKFVPSAERKVLRALGPLRESSDRWQMVSTIPTAALVKVEEMLMALGMSRGALRH